MRFFWMGAGGVAAIGFALGLRQAWDVRVTRLDIPLENLPVEAEGMRVLQISDIHFGALSPKAWLRHLVRLANSENADLIALTGDFISRRNSYARITGARTYAHPADVYAREVAAELAQLEAPLGVFAVPGNHDYAEADYMYLADILAAEGIRSLVNEITKLANGVLVAGVDDRRCGHPNVCGTLREVDPEVPQIILSHNPRSAWLMRFRNALILSGHTHGGQIRLLGILKTPVDVLRQHWIHGLVRLERAKLYVSAGAGSIFVPLRYRVPAEITVFTLTSQ